MSVQLLVRSCSDCAKICELLFERPAGCWSASKLLICRGTTFRARVCAVKNHAYSLSKVDRSSLHDTEPRLEKCRQSRASVVVRLTRPLVLSCLSDCCLTVRGLQFVSLSLNLPRCLRAFLRFAPQEHLDLFQKASLNPCCYRSVHIPLQSQI